MINFMCQFGCARGCPDETLFLGVSVRVILADISIWISRLRKEVCPPHYVQASPNSLRPWVEQKRMQPLPALPTWAGTAGFSCPWTGTHTISWCIPGPQVFRLRLELYYQLFWVSSCRWQIMGLLGLCNQVSQCPHRFGDWGVQDQGTRFGVWWMPASSPTVIFSLCMHMAQGLGSSVEPLLPTALIPNLRVVLSLPTGFAS